MSEEAPERIWAWPSERGWYAAECSYEVNLGLLTPECDLQTEYIRADIHEDRIKELEDQLAWQPIETAPKTGISVLLWDEDSSECTVGWYRINHKDDSWRSEYDLDIDATHWMPLPNMPKENNTNE